MCACLLCDKCKSAAVCPYVCSFVCMFVCLSYVCLRQRIVCASILFLFSLNHFPQWPETKQNIKAPTIIRDVECVKSKFFQQHKICCMHSVDFHEEAYSKDVYRIANSVDPDLTAIAGAV